MLCKKKLSAFLAVSILLVSGCASNMVAKRQAYPLMYSEKPLTILILPSVNNSTAADAPLLFSATIAEPVANAGYYVLPTEITERFLKNEGISSGEELLSVPPQKFGQLFGADAVLYVAIDKWNTSYFVVGGNVKVGLDFRLKSTRTGELLWKYRNELTVDTSGGDAGLGIIGKIVVTALLTASQDYVPVARAANGIAFTSIPAGKYHMEHGADGAHEVAVQNNN